MIFCHTDFFLSRRVTCWSSIEKNEDSLKFLKRSCSKGRNVTRDDLQRRFSAQHSVAIVSLRNRTAKRLCVTNVTGLLLACFVVIFTEN